MVRWIKFILPCICLNIGVLSLANNRASAVDISLCHELFVPTTADAVALFIEEDSLSVPRKGLGQQEVYMQIPSTIERQKFSGQKLQHCVVVDHPIAAAIDYIMIGLGKKNKCGLINPEIYRRAIGHAVRIAQERKNSSLSLRLPPSDLFGWDDAQLAENTLIAAYLTLYYCTDYITQERDKLNTLTSIELYVSEDHDQQAIEAGMTRGTIIAEAINMARYWIDLPPSCMTPTEFADRACFVAQECGLRVQRFGEQDVIAMGMGGLEGVSRGSDQECQFIILEYYTEVENAPTIAFVGKGITFDAGGLSIKPAGGMETMKDDMSGAAAVMGAMKAIAQLKPAVNVIALIPLSENLLNGKATKPGDILKFYNGMTAEVLNTDAEGRLVLADALSYAVSNYALDAIIDIATLTGACWRALGPFYSGLMSRNDDLVGRLANSSARTGERIWQLPLDDDYKPALKSDIADMRNIGVPGYEAGATVAALFLEPFVGDVPWAHLDIAGTAFKAPGISYLKNHGATGVGVRLLVDLATSWSQ